MPTYDYRCDRTDEMFELWQSFSDDALTQCPQTHNGDAEGSICGAPVRKVFSKVGISFKGDGFYKNDHGANAFGRKSESTSTSSAKDSSSSSSSSSSSNGSSSSESSASDSSSSSAVKSSPSSSSSSS